MNIASTLENDGAKPITAISPGNEAFSCSCGKPGCAFAALQPIREHIARLYRAIAACDHESQLSQDWQAVLFPLQIAASIRDIDADTSYVDNTHSALYCESVAEYDDAHSDIARRYVAGVTVFTFLWRAYEAAVQLVWPDRLRRLWKEGNVGERGRRLFEDFPDNFPSLRYLTNVARLAEFYCDEGKLFEKRLYAIREKLPDRDLKFSAELCREFRNFITHGEDQVPEPAGWSGDGRQTNARIYRLYAISRLLLLLIQAFAYSQLEGDPSDVEWGYDDDGEQLMASPKIVFADLHLLDAASEKGAVRSG